MGQTHSRRQDEALQVARNLAYDLGTRLSWGTGWRTAADTAPTVSWGKPARIQLPELGKLEQ
jgi:hypothetical protein